MRWPDQVRYSSVARLVPHVSPLPIKLFLGDGRAAPQKTILLTHHDDRQVPDEGDDEASEQSPGSSLTSCHATAFASASMTHVSRVKTGTFCSMTYLELLLQG